MFGCKDCIPPKFADIDKAWIGTDNASWIMRLKKRVQYWLAIGPRGSHWYCETNPIPKTLFCFHGKGDQRFENADGSQRSNTAQPGFFLSRIQIWNRWSIAMHYVVMFGIPIPAFFFCHVYWKDKDVIKYPEYKSDHGIFKKFVFQIGYKYDGDKWMIPTAYTGGNDE